MLSDVQIVRAFDSVFANAAELERQTVLRGGYDEPRYLPSAVGMPAQIRYTFDYPASALHEAAHWLRAGRRRRQLDDYGYWYVGEPRPAAVQRAFLRVEASVQALECALSEAAGLAFRASVDDFSMTERGREQFERRVREEAARCERAGWSEPVNRFRRALWQVVNERQGGACAASA